MPRCAPVASPPSNYLIAEPKRAACTPFDSALRVIVAVLSAIDQATSQRSIGNAPRAEPALLDAAVSNPDFARRITDHTQKGPAETRPARHPTLGRARRMTRSVSLSSAAVGRAPAPSDHAPAPSARFGDGPRSPGIPAPTMSSVEAHAEFATAGGLSRGDTIKASAGARGRGSMESEQSKGSARLGRNGTQDAHVNGHEVGSYTSPMTASAPAPTRFFAKRDRQRSHEELRAVGLDVEQAVQQGSEMVSDCHIHFADIQLIKPLQQASSSTSSSSSFFPLFGKRKDTTSEDRRTASQSTATKPSRRSNEPAFPEPPLAAAPPRLSTASEGSTNAKRRLTYLQDVVAQQQQQEQAEIRRAKTPTLPGEASASSSGTAAEKYLPPLPIPPQGEMPSPPREIVVTPSSPAGPPLGAPTWSGGASILDIREAATSSLDRQRTLRAAGRGALNAGPAHVASSVENDRRPRLRHVKSLGIGRPTLDRGVSETATIRPSEKAMIKEAYGAPRFGSSYQAAQSTSSILLQPQAAFADGYRSRSPSPGSGTWTPAGARSISFTSPERPPRIAAWKTASSDDLTPTYQPGARRVLRKARSYSGILSSMGASLPDTSTQIPAALHAGRSPDMSAPEAVSGSDAGKRSRAASGSLLKGAAEWLGLRKGKRKGSGAKTPPAPALDPNEPPVPPVPSSHTADQSVPLAIPGADRRTLESDPAGLIPSTSSSQAEASRSWLSFKSRSRRPTLVSPSRPGSLHSGGGSMPRGTSTLDVQEAHSWNGPQISPNSSPAPSPALSLTPQEQTESPFGLAIRPLPPVNVPSPLDAAYFSSYRLSSASGSSDFGSRRGHHPAQLGSGSLQHIGHSGWSTPATINEFGQITSAASGLSSGSTLSGRNRPRAHSDVRQPQRYSVVDEPDNTQSKDISQLFGGGAKPVRRPTLGSRSNSAGSSVIGRVKTAINNTGRGRSGSLLRRDTTDGTASDAEMARTTSTASTLSSVGRMSRKPSSEHDFAQSPPGTWQRNSAKFLVPSPAYSQTTFAEDGVPRSSISGSMASSALNATDAAQPRRHSTQTHEGDVKEEKPSKGSGRQRALTVSAVSEPKQAPTARPLQSLRKRPGSARRLSLGVFGPSPGTSPLASSTPTFGSGASQATPLEQPRGLSDASKLIIPDFDPGYGPAAWLAELARCLSRSDVANVLASKANSTYTEALRMFMATFDFRQDPLDIALRRLLMVVALPKETQQIDRVIEAFSKQYVECQPDLYRDPGR